MAQFDVYPQPLEDLRGTHPYVVQVQSSFLKRPVAVIAVALAFPQGAQDASVLNPLLEVAGEQLVLETLALASYDPAELRNPVANLQSQALVIWDALDLALHGY